LDAWAWGGGGNKFLIMPQNQPQKKVALFKTRRKGTKEEEKNVGGKSDKNPRETTGEKKTTNTSRMLASY